MQVTVPAGVVPVWDPVAKGWRAQVHVATPYGVTRELLIPVVDVEEKSAAPEEGYAVATEKVIVTYETVPGCGPNGGRTYNRNLVPEGPVELLWSDASGSVPKRLDVRFEFEWDGKPVHVKGLTAHPKPGIEPDPEKVGRFILKEEQIRSLADEVIRTVLSCGQKPGGNPAFTSLTSTRVVITPLTDETHAVWPKLSPTQLTLVFKEKLVAGPVVPCQDPPAK